jgi:hypothetical protein
VTSARLLQERMDIRLPAVALGELVQKVRNHLHGRIQRPRLQHRVSAAGSIDQHLIALDPDFARTIHLNSLAHSPIALRPGGKRLLDIGNISRTGRQPLTLPALSQVKAVTFGHDSTRARVVTSTGQSQLIQRIYSGSHEIYLPSITITACGRGGIQRKASNRRHRIDDLASLTPRYNSYLAEARAPAVSSIPPRSLRSSARFSNSSLRPVRKHAQNERGQPLSESKVVKSPAIAEDAGSAVTTPMEPRVLQASGNAPVANIHSSSRRGLQ